MLQVCLCGAQAGYPHFADCPRPLYQCSAEEEAKWCAEREAWLSRGEHSTWQGDLFGRPASSVAQQRPLWEGKQ